MKGGKWKLCTEVVEFKAVLGDHSSWNLGQYFIGLCDCVGICGTSGLKVCYLMTDD